MTTPILPDDRRATDHAAHHPPGGGRRRVHPAGGGLLDLPGAQHEKFAEMAENNHLRRLPLPAPRGVLFDRNGKVLVENRNTFNIALVREQTKNLDETLHVLAMATGVDEAQLRETVNRRRREPSYRPIVLIENATLEQVTPYRLRQWRAARDHPSGSAGPEIPRERACGPSLRLRRRNQRDPAAARRNTRASSRARWSARPAWSRPTTGC